MMEFRTLSGGGLRQVVSVAGEGPDVVLVHGFPDTPHSWTQTESALLDAGWRVSVPWLRGYHPDTIVAGRRYDPLTIGHDALALLDAIGARRAVIVGHDWGALSAYAAAALDPERVKAIVTMGIAHPSLLPRDSGALWAARHFIALKLPWAAQACRRNDFAYFETLYRRWAPSWSGPERDETLGKAKRALSSAATLHGALAYYRALPLTLPDVLRRIAPVPGLIVGGTDEPIDASVFESSAARMPAPSRALIVEGTGHWPHREKPAVVIPELLAFVTELGPD